MEVGGGIRRYSSRGLEVFDGYPEAQMCSGGRGQLLAPWPNRLGGGCYSWNGATHQLALSEPDRGNAIHGLVRWSAWHLEATGPAEAYAHHRLHPQPGWPWTVDFAVRYELGSEGLRVTTTATNSSPVSSGPCPMGLGWHPYLRALSGEVVDHDVLELPATEVLRTDQRGLPVAREPLPAQLDFRSPRPIGDLALDHAFGGLSRNQQGLAVATLSSSDAAKRLVLWMDPAFRYVMVYSGDTLAETSRRRQGLALEPMTCPPDALRSGEDLWVLGPGESRAATWGVQLHLTPQRP